MPQLILARIRRHWPILAIVACAVPLLFLGLGNGYLWSDEGDTAVLAGNVLEHGVPRAWDGVTFTDSDLGTRVTDELVMVSHPWMQYYVTAGAFALLGESTMAARLPFALAGLATVILVYATVIGFTQNRRAAIVASVLLLCSVQFLLYSRQSRHYALSAMLTCALILVFSRMRSWRGAAVFTITAVALFHTHPIGIVPCLVLGGLTLVFRPFAPQRKWVLRTLPVMCGLTLPWLAIARDGYGENTTAVRTLGSFLARIAQFFIESASVAPLVGVVMLFAGWLIAGRGRGQALRARRWQVGEASLVLTCLVTLAGYAIVMGATQSRDELWMTGVRHTPAVIPLTVIVAGLLIAKLTPNRRALIALVLVFGCTRLAKITPWTLWAAPTASRPANQIVAFHQPPRIADALVNTGQAAFLRSLSASAPGTTGQVIEFLNANAQAGDIVITNYGWEPLYFHTRLPQGMTVLPSYPIYEAARRQGLPDYVFTAQGVRWIVWRRAWGRYRGHDCDRLIATLTSQGVPVRLVMTIDETIWENRENLHFHRFAGNDYIYPWFKDLPDTLIYQVG
jgi:4-amino-4-deoxy-L-arabinose transferase-like glycosyltransferase